MENVINCESSLGGGSGVTPLTMVEAALGIYTTIIDNTKRMRLFINLDGPVWAMVSDRVEGLVAEYNTALADDPTYENDKLGDGFVEWVHQEHTSGFIVALIKDGVIDSRG